MGPLEHDKVYLVHVSIGQIVTAKYLYQGWLESRCCGVVTLYEISKMLAIYDYPTFGKTSKA